MPKDIVTLPHILKNLAGRSLIALLGTGVVTLLSPLSPAWAAQLTQWTFDPTTYWLELDIPGGTTPQYFLLAQPPRIVLDLPNTQMQGVPEIRTYDGLIQSIRVGQFQPELTRIVIEFSPEAIFEPGHLTIQAAETSSAIAGEETSTVPETWYVRPLLVGIEGGSLPQALVRTEQSPVSQASLPSDLDSSDPGSTNGATESSDLSLNAIAAEAAVAAETAVEEAAAIAEESAGEEAIEASGNDAGGPEIPEANTAFLLPADPEQLIAEEFETNSAPLTSNSLPSVEAEASENSFDNVLANSPENLSESDLESNLGEIPENALVTDSSLASADLPPLEPGALEIPIDAPGPLQADLRQPQSFDNAARPLDNAAESITAATPDNNANNSLTNADPTPISEVNSSEVTSRDLNSATLPEQVSRLDKEIIETEMPEGLDNPTSSDATALTLETSRPVTSETEPLGANSFDSTALTRENSRPAALGTEPLETEPLETEPLGANSLGIDDSPETDILASSDSTLTNSANESSITEGSTSDDLASDDSTTEQPVLALRSGSGLPPVIETSNAQPMSEVPVIEFGQRLDGQNNNPQQTEIAQVLTDETVLVPSGTSLNLRYSRETPLQVVPPRARQEVLVVATGISDRAGEIVIPEGSLLIGRFERLGNQLRFTAQSLALGDRAIPLEQTTVLIPSSILEPNQLIQIQLGRSIPRRDP